MRPSPTPNVLYKQWTRPDPNSQFLEQRIDALDILTIGGSEIQDVRLTYEDLDGDGVPEALFTVGVSGNNVSLVVLKRKGNQWYRLASPEEFSCWCEYENSPVDILAEVRAWHYSDGKSPLSSCSCGRAAEEQDSMSGDSTSILCEDLSSRKYSTSWKNGASVGGRMTTATSITSRSRPPTNSSSPTRS